jgi:hypothetical protein
MPSQRCLRWFGSCRNLQSARLLLGWLSKTPCGRWVGLSAAEGKIVDGASLAIKCKNRTPIFSLSVVSPFVFDPLFGSVLVSPIFNRKRGILFTPSRVAGARWSTRGDIRGRRWLLSQCLYLRKFRRNEMREFLKQGFYHDHACSENQRGSGPMEPCGSESDL